MVEISENKEAAIVAAGSIVSVVCGYLAGVGLVAESALVGGVAAAVLGFWKVYVNPEKST